MNTEFEYYYNNVPEKGLCRNNLIYTSLISKDKKTFCQWYHNDEGYHGGKNEVVDPSLMEYKWNREVEFIKLINEHYPEHVPKILDIDYNARKIFLEIDGPDMWELAGCQGKDYSHVLPDWDIQMLDIIGSLKNLGVYKMSMHPSSYFIVDGKMKSINYFFCYTDKDEEISMSSLLSHISKDRQKTLQPIMDSLDMVLTEPTPFWKIQMLTFETFKTNFLDETMEKAKLIYQQQV
jgi:hypothetical protein